MCGRSGGKVVRLSEPRTGPLYETRPLGSAFGKENVTAVWHWGHLHGGEVHDQILAPDTDNQVNLAIRYLAAGPEREAFRVTVGPDGKLLQGGRPLDTGEAKALQRTEGAGYYMFVMDGHGRLYAADNRKEFFVGRAVEGRAGVDRAARTTGFFEYLKACAEDMAARLAEGVLMRQFSPQPAFDYYESVLLEEAVPCALALPGGAPSSTDVDHAALEKLRRTPTDLNSRVRAALLALLKPGEPPAPAATAAAAPASAKPEGEGEEGQEGVSLAVEAPAAPPSLHGKYRLPPRAGGYRCLGTIKPGQGVFVCVPPRKANGLVDVARFADAATLEQEWSQRQEAFRQRWEARGAGGPDKPPAFKPQRWPGQQGGSPLLWLSDVPTKGGWVCRNCYHRRKEWPLLVLFKPDRDAVAACKRLFLEDPEVGGLQASLRRRGLVTQEQATQLGMMASVAAPRRVELFHHSSFMAGGEVAAAGELKVVNGLISDLNDMSGHYLPAPRFTYQVVRELARQGADLSCLYLHWDRNQNHGKVTSRGNELDPAVEQRCKAVKDARESGGSYGSGDLVGTALRDAIKEHFQTVGVRMSDVEGRPPARPKDGAIPCVYAVEGCKEDSSTQDMEWAAEHWGYICAPCLATRAPEAPVEESTFTRPRSSKVSERPVGGG